MFLYAMYRNAKLVYIGQTVRALNERLHEHMKVNTWSHNSILVKAIRKYGVEAFELKPLLITDNYEYLLDMEQAAIKAFGTHRSCGGYNITWGGEGILGLRHTEESKQKMREAHLGKTFTEEHLRKLSEVRIGEKNHRFGVPMSKATKTKIRESKLGQKHTPAARQKMSLRRTGVLKSEEHKQKIGEAMRRSHASGTRRKRCSIVFDEVLY